MKKKVSTDENSSQTGKLSKSKFQNFKENIIGDFWGGTAAMLVALPSAIAFGLIIYAPLGPSFSGKAALAGMIGTVVLGLVSPWTGGTKRVVTAPCAPAAAVLSVFVMEMVQAGRIPNESIPIYITLVAIFAGLFQILLGYLGGGRIIKYIPYPVVTGYLSGVGVLIIVGQVSKFLGITSKMNLIESFSNYSLWRPDSIVIGLITIIVMIYGNRITKLVPAAILALLAGVATYFVFGIFDKSLLTINENPFVIGKLSASITDISNSVTNQFALLSAINLNDLTVIVVPFITLGTLLSIDTLKTCVVLDALTFSRHNSNREIMGQGVGNICSGLAAGIPGAGTMGPTLVNLNSGGRTQVSGFLVGVTSIIVLLVLSKFVAWIPIASLAGIMLVIGYRMIDKKSFELLKNKDTRLDFFVTLAVVLAAVSANLILAAGVGIGFAILLFLREQMRTSVIRRKMYGNEVFSKKVRVEEEMKVLMEHGDQTLIIELQGQLFFGTTDQLLSEIDPLMKDFKYIILDMKRVMSLDYTAAHLLKQIKRRVKKQKGYLIFSSVPISLATGRNLRNYLNELGLNEKKRLKFFDNLDLALEWVEDKTLEEEGALVIDESKPLSVDEIEVFKGLSDSNKSLIEKIVTSHHYDDGQIIFEMGDESDSMYIIRKGNVKIVLPLSDGIYHHLATFTRGSYFGDMSFLDLEKRSATAIADGEVELYCLERSKFDEIAKDHPELASKFFKQIALTISNRLRQSNIELKTLQES